MRRTFHRVRAVLVLGIICIAATCKAFSSDVRSGDAYIHFDAAKNSWTLGTSAMEAALSLEGGKFTLVKLQNKAIRRDYVVDSARPDEFRIHVGGELYSGTSGAWSLKKSEAKVLPQGEAQLTILLENDVLAVEKTYVVYPGTGILRQWVKYTNKSPRSIKVSDPYFLSARIPIDKSSPPSFDYMTGGGYFTGSQILKKAKFTPVYARTFDSTDKAEVIEVGGSRYGDAMPWGAGAYMQWFGVEEAQGGLYVGFDYWGRWAAEIGNFGGPGYIGLRVSGYEKDLAPGESLETPKAFLGVYSGDLDSMGNQLKDWQYQYLWDYTSDEYFAKIRYSTEMQWQAEKSDVDWGGGTQDNWDFRKASMFHTVDLMRYVGADVLWHDAGWHDFLGDNDGPAFNEVQRYQRKYGQGLAVWWPLYTVSEHSKIYQQHPEWLSQFRTFSGANLDTSKKEVIDYLLNELTSKVNTWGDFQWRLDSTSIVPVKNTETPMLEEYHNVMGLLAEFRRRHPHSSIDVCAGGGNLMGFETLRLSDVSQLTDGGSLQIGNYYSSYLFPPDKMDDWTRDANFTWENARFALTMAPAWTGDRGLYGGEAGLLLNGGLENLRRNMEIYRYLVTQGVAGRWSHVFHPEVKGDDPIYYFQRMSRDGHKGVVILKRFAKGTVQIYPKGLRPDEIYEISFEFSKKIERKKGSDWTAGGITLADPAPGELIYIGLPHLPGNGTDHTPPAAPTFAKKKLAVNLGVTGVELSWNAASDNNWVSYYQVFRDGQPVDKVAKATYYFDYAAAPDIRAEYEIQVVDGDGNVSPRIKAVESPGEPLTYTAAGGFLSGKAYSYQGANGWTYEEWGGASPLPLQWNGAIGHMGAYQGRSTSSLPRVMIGASWMSPGRNTDAVRAFTLPYSGAITISGAVHKDLYHTHGDGVRVRILHNQTQIWPANGWEMVAAGDTKGKPISLKLAVKKGDRLVFVVNANQDAVDDQTVWDPQIRFDRIDDDSPRIRHSVTDASSSFVHYSSLGWQQRGLNPWHSDVYQGYLEGWVQGSIAVSSMPGAIMKVKFRGTGLELLGDAGADGGIAALKLDGKDAGSIDTFSPSHIPSSITGDLPDRQVGNWAEVPAIRLWGVQGVAEGEHTLELTVTGQKNPDSIGVAIAVDAIMISDGEVIPWEEK